MAENSLPIAHTCYFRVDISNYTNLETMTARFKTAIEMCGEIDMDFENDDALDDDEEEE